MMSVKGLRYAIMAAAVICAAVSCVDDPRTEGKEVSAAFTALSETFSFKSGDKVAVRNAPKPFKASVKSGKCSLKGNVIQSEEYYAVYPYDCLKYFSPDLPVSAIVTVPTVQTAVKDAIPDNLRISTASASDDDRIFEFSELPSYLKFTIGPESGRIKTISIISEYERLSGDCAVDFRKGTEIFPMPNSASNVVLNAPGGVLEQGDYYIAALPGNFGDLCVVYEDEKGRIAMRNVYRSGRLSGEVVEMDLVKDLVFEDRDHIVSSTIYTCSAYANDVYFNLITPGPVEARVIDGEDWISVIETKAMDSYSVRVAISENAGAMRYGRIEVTVQGRDTRIIYTIVQLGTDKQQFEVLRDDLSLLYETAEGDGWKNADNWCSDAPLDEWYGLHMSDNGGGGMRLSLLMGGNGLSGNLPERFDDIPLIFQLNLSYNGISGNIPSYAYELTYNNLSNNGFTSISDVTDPEDKPIRELRVNGNQIRGSLPENLPYLPHLDILYLNDNEFEGNVPESYSLLLERDVALNLNGNRLSGDLPDKIRESDAFRKSAWTDILFQEGEGFTFDNLEIYSYTGSALDVNQNEIDLSEYYKSHEYVLYVDFKSDEELVPIVDRWYRNYHDDGLGVIATSSKLNLSVLTEKYKLECLIARFVTFMDSHSSPVILLADPSGRIILDPSKCGVDEISRFLEDKYGPMEPEQEQDPEPGPDPDPEVEDGLVTVLQSASEGNGIDVVLMGDGYTAREIYDGKYASAMNEAVEYFFDIEPYSSYRHLFNVYMVNVISKNGNALGSAYGEGNSITGDDALCFDYAGHALDAQRLKNALVIVVLDSDKFGGSTYMYPPQDGDWGNGRAVAYIPKMPMKIDFRGLVQHEAGGHGFAKLADEYVSSSEVTITLDEIANICAYAEYGWWKNVDFTSDPEKVKWAHILSDERYADEPEGVYEGARNCSRGIWRPTYDSIMMDNKGSFNAPSREAIWYRIHKLAYGSDWLYDFEDFVKYDSVNRHPEY